MNDTPCTYRISVKAAIRDTQDRIMLLREADGSWELPGGGLEQGEDPRQGLIREITEETGMTVERMSEQPVNFWTIHKHTDHPTLEWFAFLVYEVQVSGSFRSDASSDEAQEARYFTCEEAQTLPLHDNTKPYFL